MKKVDISNLFGGSTSRTSDRKVNNGKNYENVMDYWLKRIRKFSDLL